MKKIGFFGGSFDPVHFGHLALAIYVLEMHHLDQILFCPAACSPFKEATPPRASGEQRLQMLELALHGIHEFQAIDNEVKRGGISYTIDTLRELKRSDIQLRLILSEDTAKTLDKWKNAKDIVQIAPPLIGPNTFPISSTEIRNRIKKNLYCGHLVPQRTLEYIKDSSLYI